MTEPSAWANEPPKKGRQGFASLSPERRREVASLGGQAVQRNGTGHRWTSEDARAAGRKGAAARKRVQP